MEIQCLYWNRFQILWSQMFEFINIYVGSHTYLHLHYTMFYCRYIKMLKQYTNVVFCLLISTKWPRFDNEVIMINITKRLLFIYAFVTTHWHSYYSAPLTSIGRGHVSHGNRWPFEVLCNPVTQARNKIITLSGLPFIFLQWNALMTGKVMVCSEYHYDLDTGWWCLQ